MIGNGNGIATFDSDGDMMMPSAPAPRPLFHMNGFRIYQE